MNLEKQCCNYTQAYKLLALGVNARPVFVHRPCPAPSNVKYHAIVTRESFEEDKYGWPYLNTYAAYTSAELGEMLPSEVQTEREPGVLTHVWVCADEMNHQVAFPGGTEAAAKADMLIWLLEKGHVTAEEVNKRLVA